MPKKEKVLTPRLADTRLPNVYRTPDILAQVTQESVRIWFGGLTRDAFVRSVFQEEDLAELPLGHLLDHRVQMPAIFARDLLGRPRPELGAVLRRMLCAIPHQQGSHLVAEALTLNPDKDAGMLREIGLDHEEFAVACLAGRHGEALMKLRAHPAENLRKMLASMALYYGALDNQLIAARQRAIGAFRIGIVSQDSSHTVGSARRDRAALLSGLKWAAAGVMTDDPLRGRRPDLISLNEQCAETGWAILKDAGQGGTDDALLSVLRETLPELVTLAEQLEREIQQEITQKQKAVAGASEDEMGKNAKKLGRRAQISTVWAGVTSSWQLLYAAKRLCAFSKQIDSFIEAAVGMDDVSRDHWLRAGLSSTRAGETGKVFIVNRSVIWRPNVAEQATRTDGEDADLRALLASRASDKKWIGEDISEKAGSTFKKWARKRRPTGSSLEDSQHWDILPDFRFSTDATSRETVDRHKRDATEHEFHPHRPSARYRAPRRSHRPC